MKKNLLKILSALFCAVSALLFSCTDNNGDDTVKSEIPNCNGGYVERDYDEANLIRFSEFSSFVDSWKEPESYMFTYSCVLKSSGQMHMLGKKNACDETSVYVKDGKIVALKNENFTLNLGKEWAVESSIEDAEKNYFIRIKDLLESIRDDWKEYSAHPYYEVNISASYDSFGGVNLPCVIKGDDVHPYKDYLFEIKITDFKLNAEIPSSVDFDSEWHKIDEYTYAESDDANKSRFEEFSAFVDSWEEPSSYTFSYLATDLWKFPNCSEKSVVEDEPAVVTIHNGEIVDFHSPYDDDWSDEKQREYIKEYYYLSIQEMLWRLRYDWRAYTAHPYENVTITSIYDDVGGKRIFRGITSEDLNSDDEYDWYDFSIQITDFQILDD